MIFECWKRIVGSCTSTWLANWRTYFTHCQLCAKCWAQSWCMAVALFHPAQRSIIICMFAFGIGWCMRCSLAPYASPSRVPCGATGDDLHVRVTCPLPQRAAKRIMAMNKSAVAIDHPVILSDMQSANVTPLFINRARALTYKTSESERVRARAISAGVEIAWFTRAGVCLLWLAGWLLGWHARPSRRCVLNNFLSADTWREKWPIAQIDSLLLSVWTGKFMDF